MRWLLLLVVLITGCGERGIAPDDDRFMEAMNEGRGHMGRFDFVRAHAAFARAVEFDPGSIEARLDLGIARLNQVDATAQEDALTDLEAVLEVEPRNPRANYCSGISLLYLGRPESALPYLELVAELRPEDASCRYFLGQALEQVGQLDDARRSYERALELDPLLRSSWLGVQRVERQLGNEEAAALALTRFEALARNPRSRLAEFRYSRMGELAMATLPERPDARLTRGGPPAGAPPGIRPMPFQRLEVVFEAESPARGSIQVVDLDADGISEVVLAGHGSDWTSSIGRLKGDDFTWSVEHPLALVTEVRCMLFGDVDGNGRVDAFICRDGVNQLMMQDDAGGWSPLPDLPVSESLTVDGALVDLDHDGDLDVFCVNDGGSNRLLNNDGDGTFTDITEQAGVGGGDVASRQVVVADLDLDRDADLLVINRDAPNRVHLNDRMWRYSSSPAFEGLEQAPIASAVGWYASLDGEAALRVRTVSGELSTWSAGPDGLWAGVDQAQLSTHIDGRGRVVPEQPVTMALANCTGDDQRELLVARSYGIELRDDRNQLLELGTFAMPMGKLIDFSTHLVDPTRGPGVLLLSTRGLYRLKASGSRGRFATVRFSGRLDDAQQMRSNASGIGTRWSARVASTWQSGATWRSGSGPGQGLQPVSIGLGDRSAVDFIDMVWPDGVHQTEIGVPEGGPTLIAETQRQISSCPLVFMRGAGEDDFRFLTDVLGVGGMGYLVEPGVAASPRPVESLLLPERPVELRLAEPMEEACYLDAVGLVAIDVPEGVEVVLDERLGIEGPAPTSKPLTITDVRRPVAARNDRGEEVLAAILEHDLVAADPGPLDPRFIGLLEREHVLEIEFASDITDCDLLLAEGWVEYPYSQTNFAAWQSDTTYEPASLEARDASGEWVPVAERFGYPAGMPRAMSLPIDALPAGSTAIRLRSNQEIYWDRIRLARRSDVPIERHEATASDAELARCGFPERTTGEQRQPRYDYQRRSPFGDVRHQTGHYTSFGPCLPLVDEVDDACAIIGPGEELRIHFADLPEPGPGLDRFWVLELNGWCKDMDLFTLDGERLEPLPSRGAGGPDTAARALMARFNLRFASGR